MNRIAIYIVPLVVILTGSTSLNKKSGFTIELKPQSGLMTETIQKAIVSCVERGGGTVVFTAGTYICGGIELKNHVTLQFEKGALLKGSDRYTDYKNDAFIFGTDLMDVAIRGDGIIDGVDCYNPNGEEGFRGPHCIRLINCKNISLGGFTIKNSANWAINCRYCSFAKVDHVSIRGGHDGLHTRFCNDFTVNGCDFRTGDDAFAGNDNRNFLITNCRVNTSCNGFRMGCFNFTVKHCRIWGPGESVHKLQNRNNTLSAFVHFSPKDENPVLVSGDWLIEDVTVDNVDQFYVYNFVDGLWQTGQPVSNIRFKNISATNILGAFNIKGDSDLKFKLTVEHSSFAFREGTEYKGGSFEGAKLQSPAMFNATEFDQIKLHKVTFSKSAFSPLMNCNSGNSIVLDKVIFIRNDTTLPYQIVKVKSINLDGIQIKIVQ